MPLKDLYLTYKSQIIFAFVLILQILNIVIYESQNYQAYQNRILENQKRILEVTEITKKKKGFQISGTLRQENSKWKKLILNTSEDCHMKIGDVIEFENKVYDSLAFRNPGVFNYQRYLFRQGILGKAYFKSCENIKTISHNSATLTHRYRNRFYNKIENLDLNHSEWIQKLSLGKKTNALEETEIIRRAGLSHLFVISGLHFGLMVSLIYGLFWIVFSTFPKIFLIVPRPKILAVFTLTFTLLFWSLAENHPSINRSALMISLYLLAILLEKEKHLFHIFLTTIVINLAISPYDLFSTSFQLSYFCVGILILSHYRFQKFKIKNKILAFFLEIFSVSAILTIGLQPLLLHYFGNFNLNAIFNNLWAIPLFQFFIVPLVLLSLLCTVFEITTIPLHILDYFLDIFFKILRELEPYQALNFHLSKVHLSHLFLIYTSIFLILFIKKHQLKTLFVFFLMCCLFIYPWRKPDLEICQIDVGKGDAILIRSSKQSILIDTGGHRFLDIGEFVLIPYLKHKWISKIDGIFLTHDDWDHYGGLKSLSKEILIENIWIQNQKTRNQNFESLVNSQQNTNINRVFPGQKIAFDDFEIAVLHPPKEHSHSKNNSSLVLLVNHKKFKGLFTGDIESTIETRLLETHPQIFPVTYLKLSHHGSKTSSNEGFLKTAAPLFTTTGSRKNSPYHPHPEIMKRLEKLEIEFYDTGRHGEICLEVFDDEIRLSTFNGFEKMFSY